DMFCLGKGSRSSRRGQGNAEARRERPNQRRLLRHVIRAPRSTSQNDLGTASGRSGAVPKKHSGSLSAEPCPPHRVICVHSAVLCVHPRSRGRGATNHHGLFAISSAGLRLKKSNGRSSNPFHATGITGQSSARTM